MKGIVIYNRYILFLCDECNLHKYDKNNIVQALRDEKQLKKWTMIGLSYKPQNFDLTKTWYGKKIWTRVLKKDNR